jgi:hypothetical protein
LFADLPEVMKERPAINIEGVLDDAQECPFASVCEVVVYAWVVVLGIRDADSHLVGLLQMGK